MCSYLRGVSRWFTPLACGPGSPELSKSYVNMASNYLHLHAHCAARNAYLRVIIMVYDACGQGMHQAAVYWRF